MNLKRYTHRRYAKFRLQLAGLYDIPHSIRPFGIGGVPAMDPGDLWNLYNLVKGLQPRGVIEYGAGASTYIILKALEYNGKGELASIERDEVYGKRVLAWIPGGLKSYLTAIPEFADLIYVDDENPALEEILRHLSLYSKTTILIDGRKEQTKRIVKNLLQHYRSRVQVEITLYDNTLITISGIPVVL